MYQLFDAFARRYDFHTPPNHYQHDHQLVLDLAREHGASCRILDVGCGTGVLVAKARAAGFEAYGLDASPGMVAVARTRVPHDAVRVQRMEDLNETARYDLIIAMSWSIHYCEGELELESVLSRMRRAIRPGGHMLLQVAHAPNLPQQWSEDHETGPGGVDDVRFRYRFRRDTTRVDGLLADYSYSCTSLGEAFEETHILIGADVNGIASRAVRVGLTNVECWNSWKRDWFGNAGSAFVFASAP